MRRLTALAGGIGVIALCGCGGADAVQGAEGNDSGATDATSTSSTSDDGSSSSSLDAGGAPDADGAVSEGSDGSDGSVRIDSGDAGAPEFLLRGTVIGLAGSGLVLRDGAIALPVDASGSFAFPSPFAAGTSYAIGVATQPSDPTQMCSVTNGVGTIGAADALPITVTCSTDAFTVGGSISGLSGSVVLQDEGGDDLTVSSAADAGSTLFHFAMPVASGAQYAVTVHENPIGQTCVVAPGTGSGPVAASAITSVVITCTNDPTYTVGGTISGLVGSVVLQDNGGDNLTVSHNGSFTFPTALLSGAAYDVSVLTQPASPANVTCVVTTAGASGHVSGANSTGAIVTCSDNAPDTFASGATDVVTVIKTASQRLPISPLIYGVNGEASDLQGHSAAFLKAISFTRRGGDRGNTYDWETNVSNGGIENGYASDMLLAGGLPNANAPAGQDLYTLGQNRAATPQRATMVPFVLNDYVAAQVVDYIPYDQPGFVRSDYFNKVAGVKPTPYATTPNLTDGMVYTDEHLAYMRAQYTDDIMAPGPGQLIVGIDNEPDLWDYNFPMLQAGTGDALYATTNGAYIGNKVTVAEFEQRVIAFATKVKTLSPSAYIVGPSHYGYDGFRGWNTAATGNWPDLGTWFMDDFLADMSTASTAAGMRFLDTWDFHWYPQATYNGVTVSALDNNASALTSDEIQAIVQGPRSYWDTTYNEGSWITSQYHLNGPAYIIKRLQAKIAAAYPGTSLGVSEYFPGGLNHISSGIATADTLGVFQRMGIALAAMWPNGSDSDCRFAFGGIELLRNADGNGLTYANTSVEVDHPEIAPSSVYAGMDTPDTVTVLVINKTTSARTFGLEMYNGDKLGKVAIYTLDAAHAVPYLAKSDTLTLNNAYAFASEAMSASMLVFQTSP